MSVATHLKCGGNLYASFVGNLVFFLAINESEHLAKLLQKKNKIAPFTVYNNINKRNETKTVICDIGSQNKTMLIGTRTVNRSVISSSSSSNEYY